MTDPVAHGLTYIHDRYSDTPEPEPGWYERGGFIATPDTAMRLTIREPEPTLVVINDKHGHPILTVHPDGRVTLDQPDKADEAAHTFADELTRLLTGRLG